MEGCEDCCEGGEKKMSSMLHRIINADSKRKKKK
jgi:hypothetical protein